MPSQIYSRPVDSWDHVADMGALTYTIPTPYSCTTLRTRACISTHTQDNEKNLAVDRSAIDMALRWSHSAQNGSTALAEASRVQSVWVAAAVAVVCNLCSVAIVQ